MVAFFMFFFSARTSGLIFFFPSIARSTSAHGIIILGEIGENIIANLQVRPPPPLFMSKKTGPRRHEYRYNNRLTQVLERRILLPIPFTFLDNDNRRETP